MALFDERLREATALHARGDLDGAAVMYEALIGNDGNQALLYRQLGIARLQQGRLDDAAALLDRAVALADDPETRAWQGEVLRRQGRPAEAIALFEDCLRRHASFAPALFNLGLARDELGQPEAAVESWQRFLSLRPRDRTVRRELGRLAYRAGDFATARARFFEQLTAFPDDAVAAIDLAETMLRQSDYEACIEVATRAASLAPNAPRPVLQVARAADRLADLPQAIAWFERARSLAPQRADILNELGVAQLNFGEIENAVASFRAAIERQPGFSEAHSNLLMALHYREQTDPAQLFAEHVQWATRHAQFPVTPRASFDVSYDGARRLRIGYVSPRFCGGPMGRLFLPLLAAHDRSRFEITCYANSPVRDHATDTMRGLADRWRECHPWDDAEMLRHIRDDAIDVLVDLSGHCPGNRLRVFAHRAAPVQMTHIDYVDTTGIAAMDYFVTDAQHTPAGSTQRYTERLATMPVARFCYAPASDCPPPRPVRDAGVPFTFGCFNRLSKLSPGVVRLWGRLLAECPRARLLLKATAFASHATRDAVATRFVAAGARASQLDFRPVSPEPEMLRQYNEVDVALDPFPYTGGTTTCDALSMGVPVITLPGETFASRHATAMLHGAGFDEWVAHDAEDYLAKARSFANGAMALPQRGEVRAQLLRSPVCDAAAYAAALERIYVESYRRALGEGD